MPIADELRVRVREAAGAASVLVPFGCSVLLYTGEGMVSFGKFHLTR